VRGSNLILTLRGEIDSTIATYASYQTVLRFRPASPSSATTRWGWSWRDVRTIDTNPTRTLSVRRPAIVRPAFDHPRAGRRRDPSLKTGMLSANCVSDLRDPQFGTPELDLEGPARDRRNGRRPCSSRPEFQGTTVNGEERRITNVERGTHQFQTAESGASCRGMAIRSTRTSVAPRHDS